MERHVVMTIMPAVLGNHLPFCAAEIRRRVPSAEKGVRDGFVELDYWGWHQELLRRCNGSGDLPEYDVAQQMTGARATAAAFDQDHTFMLVEIAGDEMSVRTLTRTGRVVDSGVITRPPRPPQTSSGEPPLTT
jgi:hypothetical protein